MNHRRQFNLKVSLAIVLVSVLVTTVGCGGGDVWGGSSKRFVNKTNLNDAQFQALAEQKWKEAQEAIATQVQYDLEGNIVSVPDEETAAAARSLRPSNVIIRGMSEVPASELNALPNCQHCPYKDPSGLIYCPNGHSQSMNNIKTYCNAYMDRFCEIAVPVSKPEYMGPYEMENCILYGIGRDPQNR